MSNKQWDGKFSNLKISEDSNPELHSELAPLNHKGRGERLRFLASLGLMHLRQMNSGHMLLESKTSRSRPQAKAVKKSQLPTVTGTSTSEGAEHQETSVLSDSDSLEDAPGTNYLVPETISSEDDVLVSPVVGTASPVAPEQDIDSIQIGDDGVNAVSKRSEKKAHNAKFLGGLLK